MNAPQRKPIAAAAHMGRLMGDYFLDLDEASRTGSRKVAWCTSVGPAELLRAMGYVVYFPENHGAVLGSSRCATDLIPVANALGYSPDICSYLKGTTPLSKAYPQIQRVPKPDVLVYNTNQCRDVQDWFGWYARELKVPCIGITSPRSVIDVEAGPVEDVARQIEALVPTLEQVAGTRLDIDRLRETVALSRQCSDLWGEVLATAAHRPAPLTFFDGTIHMGPAVCLRGTPQALAYYRELLAEMKQRIADGVAAVERERLRLYWEGMPVWGRLRQHSELFASQRTAVVASTYCSSWVFKAFDGTDPFRSMARAYLQLFIVRDEAYKERYLQEMLERFGVDGILYHDAKTCPNNSNNRYGLPQRLEARTGVPSLVISGDLNDMRCVSDEQTRINVEAFVEQLMERA